MTLDPLQQRYQAAVSSRHAEQPCPLEPEEMLAVLQGQASDPVRTRVLAAVASHPRCREEFQLLRAVVLAGAPARRVGRRFVGWALAATILVAAGLATLGRLRRPATAPVYRSGGDSVVLVPVIGPSAGDSVVRLAWRPVLSAWLYEVTVVAESGGGRWRATTHDTMLAVADSLLPPGAIQRWWVTARLDDGSELRSREGVLSRPRQ